MKVQFILGAANNLSSKATQFCKLIQNESNTTFCLSISKAISAGIDMNLLKDLVLSEDQEEIKNLF